MATSGSYSRHPPSACSAEHPEGHASQGLAREYESLVERIRRIVPEVTLRTTLIAGFPETERFRRALAISSKRVSITSACSRTRAKRNPSIRFWPTRSTTTKASSCANVLRDLADDACTPACSRTCRKSHERAHRGQGRGRPAVRSRNVPSSWRSVA